jgi:hypothetical protein
MLSLEMVSAERHCGCSGRRPSRSLGLALERSRNGWAQKILRNNNTFRVTLTHCFERAALGSSEGWKSGRARRGQRFNLI